MIAFEACFMEREEKPGKRGIFYYMKWTSVDANSLKNGIYFVTPMGIGVRVKNPFKVQIFLGKSPKTFTLFQRKLLEHKGMLIEKLSLDFNHWPFTLLS